MNRLALVIAATLLGAPLVASASDGVGDTYIGPSVGFSWNATAAHVRNGADADLSIGHNFTRDFSLELNMGDDQVQIDNPDTHRSIQNISLDALRVWNRDAEVAPYLEAGIGGTHGHTLNPSPAVGPSMEAGAGAFVKVWHNADNSSKIFFRPDVKARWDDVGSSGHVLNYIASVGLVFAFGHADQAAPMPVVYRAPAPAPTPAPAPVEAPRQMVVAPTMIELDAVHFDFDKANLKLNYIPGLDRTAQSLKSHPEMSVEVQGHTDSKGSAAYNKALSVRRAKVVRQYLIKQGVPSAEMTAKGYGKTQPIASNDTEEGRAQNRRTVIKVLKNPNNVNIQDQSK